ncbi:MAG: ROK family protein [Aggregatilineales bacterium]
MANEIIGVDLGGTRVRAALLDKSLRIIRREETLTLAEGGLDATLDRIKALIHLVLPTDGKPAGIGISAPGPLNPKTGVVVAPPNLPGWHDVPLGDILSKEFGVPVYVGNDANVAALAEAVRGAAYGYRHAIYLTVSTGIGSGIITDGRLLLGRSGLAAEAGHMVMLVGDRTSTLELEAAGPDMATHAVKRIKAGEKSSIVDLVDGELDKVQGATVGIAAHQGDALALDVVRRSWSIIGSGIVTLLHLFNPDIIVIGGGVTANLHDIAFEPMWDAIKAQSIDDDYWKDLKIVLPVLGEDVSVIGAGVLVATNGGVADLTEVTRRFEG